MNPFLIVTNNPRTSEKYPDSVNIEGSPADVIREVGNFLLKGYSLWSVPLPPNGRLMRNPFRSVVLQKNGDPHCGRRDFLMISNAEERLSRMNFLPGEGRRGEDLALMDLELLDIALCDL
ncbi:MAG: hypothetical protein STSR0007_10290 [Thermovirga sp.]